jgi:hypothetical protein
MAASDQKPQFAAIFTLDQQTLIGQIVYTKISEIIASSSSLVCSHCSSSSSNNPVTMVTSRQQRYSSNSANTSF